jgi:hypothetical protein
MHALKPVTVFTWMLLLPSVGRASDQRPLAAYGAL